MRFAKRLANGLGNDRGSASLEFITAGLILLVPLVYLVVALAQIQGGALAVTGAARQAARAFVLAETADQALDRVEAAVRVTLADYDVPSENARVEITCDSGTGEACLARGEVVTVTVAVTVALPLAPEVLDLDRVTRVPLESRAVQKVSRFWGTP